MIYIFSGNDFKKMNTFIKTITKDYEPVFFGGNKISKESICEYAENTGLFGEKKFFIFEKILDKGEILFKEDDVKKLADSSNIFIFIEDKLSIKDEKIYRKYAKIENFGEKINFIKPKTNTFAIADAFAGRDKIKTWMLYCESIDAGIEPEAISGILFWKIKMMILNGTKYFSNYELRVQSSNIVSLYHKAHQGECDFVIGLEQFILSSLNKQKKA